MSQVKVARLGGTCDLDVLVYACVNTLQYDVWFTILTVDDGGRHSSRAKTRRNVRSLRLILVIGTSVQDRVDGAIALADGDREAIGISRVDNEVVAAGSNTKGCQSWGGARQRAEIFEADHFCDNRIDKVRTAQKNRRR